MQAVYSAYYSKGQNQKNSASLKHEKQRDYLVRSEKRTPYDDGRRSSSGGKRGGEPGKGVLYLLLTLLLLIVVYPVGLFFLWNRRANIGIGAKLLLTVATAIVFCVLCVFAINYDTGNPTVERVQKSLRSVLEVVNEHTGTSVEGALAWCEEKYETGKENALALWDVVDEHVAEEVLALYGYVEDDIHAATVKLPRLLLDEYKELIDYKENADDANEIRRATPDSGISVAPSPTAAPKPTSSLLNIIKAEPTSAPSATPAPTATATPAPTPVPVKLPTIKNVANAPVYFTNGGTYYHANSYCSGMMNAVSHTLLEAKNAKKQVCDSCGVTSFAMMECEYYLWKNDITNVIHTTDECIEFNVGKYSVVPFEDVYERNYTYCTACKADVCLEYMKQNHAKFASGYEILDDATLRLHEYERSITVYYGENSRNYHANAACKSMEHEKYIHNLYQAIHVDKKVRCEQCSAPTEEEALYALNNQGV